MKKLFILVLIGFSCSKPEVSNKTKLREVEGQDFVGTWNSTDKSEEGVKIEISKMGEEYHVKYTFKAELPKLDLIPITYITKFEPNLGDPYRPRLKTIELIKGQYVTFDYVRMFNFPDQLSNLSTKGFFQKQ